MSRSLPARVLALLLLTGALAACTSGTTTSPSPSPSPTPTAAPTATPLPSPSPSGSPSAGAVVVTIQVLAETYRIKLVDPDDIAIARDLLDGKEAPGIPNGRIVYGDPGVNEGYTWQIDPSDIEWADMTTEVCDGLPSDVEAHAISGDRFCPWSAEVTSVDPAP